MTACTFLKILTSHFPSCHYKQYTFGCDWSKIEGLYLEELLLFRLYIVFHFVRHFHEISYVTLSTDRLQSSKFGSDQWLIEGSLLGDQCTFFSVSKLVVEEFSWKSTLPILDAYAINDGIKSQYCDIKIIW